MGSGDWLTSIEICAGAGGQAAGLHAAGFRHLAMVEIDKHAAASLEANAARRKGWRPVRKFDGTDAATKENYGRVFVTDVNDFKPFQEFPDLEEGELDLLAGGVPCPPFSVAGKQLGRDDERDLFPRMLQLVRELKPKAVLIENVRGLLDDKFAAYREEILDELDDAGYAYCGWKLLEAADHGVPQLRPRALLVMIRQDWYRGFAWPEKLAEETTVFAALDKSMRRRYGVGHKAPWLDGDVDEGLREAAASWLDGDEDLREAAAKRYRWWRAQARAAFGVAPTLVGGSKKHGGADLGPTRAKKAWALHGVDALGVANDAESPDLKRDLFGPKGPMLTVEQAAIIQGFPADWIFEGGKTARYRQIGNAFPPPVAEAVGRSIAKALALTGPVLAPPPLPHREATPLIPRQHVVAAQGREDLECATRDVC